jgi:hypothetical protein
VARRDFERRQARVQRLLNLKYGVRTFGYNLIPNPVWEAGPRVVVDRLAVKSLPSEDVGHASSRRSLSDGGGW